MTVTELRLPTSTPEHADAVIKMVSLLELSNNGLPCGGNDVSVEVCAQGQCCNVPIGAVNPEFKYTETNLPNCDKVRASDVHQPMVRVLATNEQNSCTGKVEVRTNFDKYEIHLTVNSRPRQTNYISSYSVTDDSDSNRPQSTPCPSNPTVESCPTNQMRMRGHLPQRKNQVCQFLCDQVVFLDPGMPSSTSGYFCTPLQNPMLQPKWCCLDGRKNDIPGCNELVHNGNESKTSTFGSSFRWKRGIEVNFDPTPNSLQAFGAVKKSYNTFNEHGAHIIQETIEYEEDNIVTITTPQHHDLDFTKMVFDKESNHMMQVYLDYKKCVIHHQPMLPVSPNSGLFENLKVAEGENTYESPIDQKRLVEKVSLEVYVNPNPIPFTSLPAKFQKHCPSTFTVYKAHMVDPQRVTPEDPNDLSRNITTLNDAFDFEEPLSGRVKRDCRMASGETAVGCHEVTSICDQGCSMSNTRYKCSPKGTRRSCAYVLWDCGPTISNNGCVKHFYSGTNFCDICCINKNCGQGMPKCFS